MPSLSCSLLHLENSFIEIECKTSPVERSIAGFKRRIYEQAQLCFLGKRFSLNESEKAAANGLLIELEIKIRSQWNRSDNVFIHLRLTRDHVTNHGSRAADRLTY